MPGDVLPAFSQVFTFTATCAGDPNSPCNLSNDYPTATNVTQSGNSDRLGLHGR